MAMHRLLVPEALLAMESVAPPPDAARHLRAIRPKPGEPIELFDGLGHVRRYKWDGGTLRAAGGISALPPRRLSLTLFACVTKGSRWDWTIEKAVELGAARIVPVISDRCIVRLAPGERAAKAERWRRIAADAARQSDAAWLPEVLEAVDFPEAVELVRGCDRVFVGALADPPPPPLWAELARELDGKNPAASLGVFVGPEGDFTPDELRALLKVAVPVSLGPTILRAETAAIFALSVLAAAGHAATTAEVPH